MAKKYNRSRMKKVACAPRVGIFWIINEQVVAFHRDLIGGELTGDSPYDHIQVWSRVQSAFPRLRSKDYDNIPRGRVTLVDGVFNILVGSDWRTPSLVEKIRREFCVPRNKMNVLQDEHYLTQTEDPMMTSILNGEFGNNFGEEDYR